MHRHVLGGLVIALSLAGCASGPAPLSPQEIAAARQSGGLERLYDQYALRLAGHKLTTPEGQAAVARLNDLGKQLADTLEQDIRRELSQQATASGLAPLPVIEAQLDRLPKVQQWAPETHDRLTAELNERRSQTRGRITAQQNRLARFTEDELGQRVEVLDDLAALTGDARYTRESADVVATLRRKVAEALASEQYGEARRALKALQLAAPEDRSLGGQLTRVEARLFEKRFWDSLADGRPDEAYTQFMNLSQAPDFPAILAHLSASRDDMEAYFIAEAGVALSEKRLADAYVRLNQARDLRNKTSAASKLRAPQEDAFLKAVAARYQEAAQAGRTGLALGYLKVVERFQPDFPDLHAKLRATLDGTLDKAIPTVDIAAFSELPGSPEAAAGIAPDVARHLAGKLPDDIRVIGRDASGTAAREATPGAAPVDTLAGAHLLVQGNILESRVDTHASPGTKTLRVVAQEQPQDITLDLQLLHKVGVLSATYRLVETASGKVLAAGSESARVEYGDEGHEGIERGEFRLPARVARLPTDAEVLQQLSAKLAAVIGDKLEQELKNAEVRHAEAARRQAEEGDAAMAAEHQARAFAIATLKGLDVTQARLALEQYALKAP